ncbi:MAG: phage terminase large subunit [Rhodospirillales bacterium]|nr:phage terminase large subunit [Rhodospirillales bacterium]MCB9964707.1 phage terminase large subunit [Rhodospirillales bacterium]MCB9980069.1 phage terminase large subunit [Rhodospirillales bacterium]
MSRLSFKKFVALWNVQQNQETPHLHFRIARWLERMHQTNQNRLLLMAFRACGKSTMVGLYAAWRLYRNPNLRILVVSADDLLAGKMVRNIKRIIERNIVTQHLRPKSADQWGADRFTVLRDQELRDPSVLARGITANMTGSRADLIICDDVEVPNTADSREKRQNLRDRLAETDFILMPDGMKLFAGTPHSYHSIYTRSPAADHEDEAAFLQDYVRLELPLLDQNGECLWPERYAPQMIEQMRRSVGPNMFASQMLLQPINIRNGRLDASLLRIYHSDIAYVKELNRLEIDNIPMRSAAAWWDPAFGLEGGDRSVLAIAYQDESGHYWLQHLAVLKPQKLDHVDMAAQQCQEVARLLKTFMIPSVALEINGLGRFLPGILRKELMRHNVSCSVLEISSRRPKDLRIMEAFDVLLASERLHVHRDVMATPFATELSEWRPGSKGHDDCLDAVAGALSLQPVRIGYAAPPGRRQGWTKGHAPSQAETDFKV